MAGADRNAFLIEDRADVVRMNVVNHKGKHAGLFASRANDPDTFNRREFFGCIAQQVCFVRRGRFTFNGVQVVERRAQSNLRFRLPSYSAVQHRWFSQKSRF